VESVAVIVKIDGNTLYARLVAWGRTPGVWWGLVLWKQRILITATREQGEINCSAWLPATSIRQQSGVGASDVIRIGLPDDRRAWPAPFAWFTGWHAGAILSGPLPWPPAIEPDNRPEWDRRRDRGEHRERKRR
jgi:hypothetical protein